MADSNTNTEQQPKKQRGRRPGSKNKTTGATQSGTILTAGLRSETRDFPSARTDTPLTESRTDLVRGIWMIGRVMAEHRISEQDLLAAFAQGRK